MASIWLWVLPQPHLETLSPDSHASSGNASPLLAGTQASHHVLVQLHRTHNAATLLMCPKQGSAGYNMPQAQAGRSLAGNQNANGVLGGGGAAGNPALVSEAPS